MRLASNRAGRSLKCRVHKPIVPAAAFLGLACASLLAAQVETVRTPAGRFVWVSQGHIEGHLALDSSPAGAFSPDSKTLAVISGEKVVLTGFNASGPLQILHPGISGLKALNIQSANFIAPGSLFMMGRGTLAGQGSNTSTPMLALTWDIQNDQVTGKVEKLGSGGGYGPIIYLPEIRYVAMAKDNLFVLWNPATGKSLALKIPDLTQAANIFTFSPDGKWLLLAQIQGNGSFDPAVVRLSDDKFADVLRGHQSTVLSLNFSRDGSKVVTASEDGTVRIYTAPDWKLLATLTGHRGPARWAEFSPDGRLVVSAGDDKTVRVWSAEDGKLEQTLQEPDSPVRTAAFSPNGEYIAATGEQSVYIWKKSPTD
jgi:WD domain, G-beta repeat